MIGGHSTGSLVRHVMESIAFHAGICLHMQVLAGRDPHHIAEAEFKALARALRFAVEIDPRVDGVPRAPREPCDDRRQVRSGRIALLRRGA